VNTLWEKAIRFRHPDYDPDRAQKLISSSMSRHLSTHNISSKFINAFLSNLAHRQTDRQTNAARGRKHVPPPLSDVKKTDVYWSPRQFSDLWRRNICGITSCTLRTMLIDRQTHRWRDRDAVRSDPPQSAQRSLQLCSADWCLSVLEVFRLIYTLL